MNASQLAFFIGLFGSVHCIGMCGPLALAVPSLKGNWWLVVFDKLLYNTGRVITYTFLGLLIGLLGRQLWLAGLQQAVSILTGLLIITAGFSRVFKFKLTKGGPLKYLLRPFNNLMIYGLKHKAGHFMVGVLNGFLPCGFVYLALAGAVNTGSPIASAGYMFWFGMGTFPLMLIAMVSSGSAGPGVRRYINKGIPYLMICLGFWFVLRGSGLNIPYLSPAKQPAGVCR